MPHPGIALTVGLMLVGVCLLILWPKGPARRLWMWLRRGSRRILLEDMLKFLSAAELSGQSVTPRLAEEAFPSGSDPAAAVLAELQNRGLVTATRGGLRLTPAGRQAAWHVLRAHRLWERHLADETGFPETEWHSLAERQEHKLSSDEADALAARLGRPTRDPHGDPIPGDVVGAPPMAGRPLTVLSPGNTARIVHLEDEPEALYSQLVKDGLYPGQVVRLIEVGEEHVRFVADGMQHVLPKATAANVTVRPARPGAITAEPSGEPLSTLRPGEKGRITRLSPRCRGAERRRLLDLGLVPGTLVEAELVGPGGDPTAYRVRGALLALRHTQAQAIRVRRTTEEAP